MKNHFLEQSRKNEMGRELDIDELIYIYIYTYNSVLETFAIPKSKRLGRIPLIFDICVHTNQLVEARGVDNEGRLR